MGVLKDAKEEQFAQLVASGTTQTEAYKVIRPQARNYKPETVYSKASHMAKRETVKARIVEIKEETSRLEGMSREFKRKKLQEIVEDFESSTNDKLRAIDLDNKMCGEYETKLKMTADVEVKRTPLEDILDELKEGE